MNRVEIMLGQITDIQEQIEWIQETCQHFKRTCEDDKSEGEILDNEDIFSDPFSYDYPIKGHGTVVECYCPDCLKKWVEVRM